MQLNIEWRDSVLEDVYIYVVNFLGRQRMVLRTVYLKKYQHIAAAQVVHSGQSSAMSMFRGGHENYKLCLHMLSVH